MPCADEVAAMPETDPHKPPQRNCQKTAPLLGKIRTLRTPAARLSGCQSATANPIHLLPPAIPSPRVHPRWPGIPGLTILSGT